MKKPIDPESIKNNRLFVKPACDDEMQGNFGAQDRSVYGIHEDSSTKLTQQSTSQVEFSKKSAEVKEVAHNLTILKNYADENGYTYSKLCNLLRNAILENKKIEFSNLGKRDRLNMEYYLEELQTAYNSDQSHLAEYLRDKINKCCKEHER